MKNWKTILLNKDKTVFDAIKVIDSSLARAALVVNDKMQLVGTITDGDIRRGILKGVKLESNVDAVMNHRPVTASLGKDIEFYEAELEKYKILQLPLVDADKVVCGFYIASEIGLEKEKPNSVVLMVGGLGTRLGDLTTDCPKPMLKVGGKPILETIISNFKEEGFKSFFLAVNYKSEMIENYFEDGKEFGVKIEYLRENKRMGTAGSLSLLDDKISAPIVVMNGDLLTSISINEMIKFHQDTGAVATTCIREYGFQVPFGVVEVQGTSLLSITEKPTRKCFVNAGIYVIEPSVLNKIPKDEVLDMPSLLNSLLEEGKKISAFPIREYWLDIGRREDFDRAREDYSGIFK